MADSPSGRPPILYLDMNLWIALARGRVQNDARWNEARAGLTLAVTEGRAVVPLSPAHYLELWHRRDQQSREQVGAIMRDVSGYATIPSPFLVRRMEVQASLACFAGGSNHRIVGEELIGHGAVHAFGRSEGRFRFVESLANADGTRKDGTLVTPPDIWNQIQRRGAAWEWMQLVGTQQILEMHGVDRSPEHRYGTHQLQIELKLRELLKRDKVARNRLWDVLVVEEIQSLLDEINDFSEDLGINPHALVFGYRRQLTPPEAMRSFVESLPSANTWATLRLWKHRDLTHPWEQHDWTDIWALSVAVPYCDVVLTEKRWTHLVKATGLAELYSTEIGWGISALETFLEGIA